MYRVPDSGTVKRSLEEYTDLWAEEIVRTGLKPAVFLTGVGNNILAEIVNINLDKFIGFAHSGLFSKDAAEELEHAVTKQGPKGYKIVAPRESKLLDDKSAYPVWEIAEHHKIPY